MKKNNIAFFITYGAAFLVAFMSTAILFQEYLLPKSDLLKERSKQVLSSQTTSVISSHGITTTPSNQWFSSMVFSFPSKPIFALPLAYTFSESGVGISYPQLKYTPKTIFAPYTQDIIVSIGNMTKPKLVSLGDWSLRGSIFSSNRTLDFTIGHGLPYVVFSSTAQSTTISGTDLVLFDKVGKALPEGKNNNIEALRITTGGKSYALIPSQPISITITNQTITLLTPGQFIIAILDKPTSLALFENLKSIEILDTQASFVVDDNKISTSYKIVSQNKNPLIALYPHHYDLLTKKLSVLGEYDTIRGKLKLVSASEFITNTPLFIPDSTFIRLSEGEGEIKKAIQTDTTRFLKDKEAGGQAYFLGRWFGSASNLISLCEAYGLSKEKEQIIAKVKPIFIKSLTFFSYDKSKKSVFEKKPEFGNELYNDHHFHYGYYIRAAAVLASSDPTLYTEVKPIIDLLVEDIATMQRDSAKFPYLRNFDVYESHSWADGDADFFDGNNQESTSEAINAWYSLYLWSSITKDKNLEKYSLYMLNSEITGASYYWFDKNNLYKSPYAHSIASIVWGGKVDFSTWFSADTNMIYGIQLLPLTPASSYLGTLPDFTKYEADYTKNGGGTTKPWGDLLYVFKSFYEPLEAYQNRASIKESEDKYGSSTILYFIYKNYLDFKDENLGK